MILNRQRQVRFSLKELEGFLVRAQKRLRVRTDAVTVCLVTNGRMARWNHAYRGKNRPTDVLSFPINGHAGEHHRPGYLGDIAIAPAVARQNARRAGRSFSGEMRILMLHGMLHLLGYDHETDNGQMDRFEQRLRRDLGLN
jgi:probable rRNA maturation factor